MIRKKKAVHSLAKSARFGNLPLKMKILMVQFFLIVIPFFLLFYYFMGIYISGKEQEALEGVLRETRKCMSDIDIYLQNLSELAKQPIFDDDVKNTLAENNLISYSPKAAELLQPRDSLNTYMNGFYEDQEAKPVSKFIVRILAFNPYIHSVFVMDLNGKYMYYTKDSCVIRDFVPMNSEWYDETLMKGGSATLIKSYNIYDYTSVFEPIREKRYVFGLTRTIRHYHHNLGVILINVDIAYLDDVCSNMEMVAGERRVILDGENNIVYDSNPGFIGQSAENDEYDLSVLAHMDLGQESARLERGQKKWVIIPIQSVNSEWKLVRVIPEYNLYHEIWQIREKTSFLLTVFVIAIIAVTISISYSVTNPLKKFIRTMEEIEKGDLSQRCHMKYKDEIGQLGRSFNRMLEKIEQLIHIVNTTNARKREAELQALQAQINPHFIYNTMESIRMMARLNGDRDTSQMAMILGKLLRYSINIKNKIVTVAEEIEHLKNYIAIQNYRFSNRFRLVLDIDEDLLQMQVIKLIYQPIVENFICHGMENRDGEGVIHIKGSEGPEGVIFRIEDNGCGMAAEELAAVNRRLNDFTVVEEGCGGVGLRNINERIKLFYGEAYGISIESTAGFGTTVIIRLPGMTA